jgi:hypothetical protein
VCLASCHALLPTRPMCTSQHRPSSRTRSPSPMRPARPDSCRRPAPAAQSPETPGYLSAETHIPAAFTPQASRDRREPGCASHAPGIPNHCRAHSMPIPVNARGAV